MEFREPKVSRTWRSLRSSSVIHAGRSSMLPSRDPFIEAVGQWLERKQANSSVSAAGVVRGIHFAGVPPSQTKYVMCPSGAVLDLVDIRVGSPTSVQWDTVLLDDVDGRAIYISEGLEHAFGSLEDGFTVVCPCSHPHAPGREHAINPFGEAVSIRWLSENRNGAPFERRLAEKDAIAPDMDETRQQGLLRRCDVVHEYVRSLRP